jgi:hypothetical protein
MSKSKVLFGALLQYYSQPGRLEEFTVYTSKDSPISLRLLDWLVTNFAKKNNVVYVVDRNNARASFNMFMEYKAQLKAYSKKFFDPFCRRDRVSIVNSLGVEQYTTVAQLNFFKWALTNNVIKYALANKDTIELDMLAISKKKGGGGDEGAGSQDGAGQDAERPKKRRELSSAAIKSCTKTLCHITVRF